MLVHQERDNSARGVNGIVALVGLSIFLNYVDRGAISVAAPLMKSELGLSATTFGIAVSAFFWVYAPIQLLIGRLCDLFSVYRMLSWGLALWALSTMLTSLVHGFALLLVLRIALGVGESVAFPGGSKVITRHVPLERRGFANSFMSAGMAFGPAAGTLAGGLILATLGWRAVFLIFGAVTLLWLIPWLYLVGKQSTEGGQLQETPVPWSQVIRKRELWLASAGQFATTFGFYFVMTWLPLYLVQSRGFSIPQMTALATGAYLWEGALTLIVGHFSDLWIKSGRNEAVALRNMMVVGAVGMAVGIALTAFSTTLLALAGSLLVFSSARPFVSINNYTIGQRFSGARAAGSWMGVQNAIGNGAGVIGPVLTGIIIDRTGSYFGAFALAAAICAAGAVIWGWMLPPIEEVDFG